MGIAMALLSGEQVNLGTLWQHGGIELLWTASSLSGLLFLSFFSSIVAFSIQVHAQKSLPPHIVGLIFLLESPFAALFGYLFLQEKLNIQNIIGGGLVMVAGGLLPFFEMQRKKKLRV